MSNVLNITRLIVWPVKGEWKKPAPCGPTSLAHPWDGHDGLLIYRDQTHLWYWVGVFNNSNLRASNGWQVGEASLQTLKP
jgi:hypothetical protein